jgi:hypothetical protein
MEWADPKIDAVFDDVWRMLMEGLRAEKNSVITKGKRHNKK